MFLFQGAPAQAQADGRSESPETIDFAVEISAEAWFNPQPVFVLTQPRLILLAFWSVESRESRALVKPLTELQRAYKKGELQVVGLTEDDVKIVERTLPRWGIRYKVGAGSRAGKAYRIKVTPSLVLVDLRERRVCSRMGGREIDMKGLRSTIHELLGSPEGVSRSLQMTTEERGDQNLFYARIGTASGQVSEIVAGILAARPDDEPVQPGDLSALDEFYAANLPSDPDQPAAPSENTARELALGSGDGSTGYAALFKSGRLSDETKQAVLERVLSIASQDVYSRLDALDVLRNIRPVGDENVLSALRKMRDVEGDPIVRGALDQTIDRLNPAIPEATRNNQHGAAIPLRNKLRKLDEAGSAPWARGAAYAKSASEKQTRQLVDDYWANAGSEADPDRDNKLLCRLTGVDQLERRFSSDGTDSDRNYARDNLLDMLSLESDLGIRWSIVGALRSMGQHGEPADRDLIRKALQNRLESEPDAYFVRPRLEQAIGELQP